MSRARTALSAIESLRRLGAIRRRRTFLLGDGVYRVRRDRLVRIPDRFVHGHGSGAQRQCRGRGSGRMDWERQRQVLRECSRPYRRRYSLFTRDAERQRRERVDRWSLRIAMAEWLYEWGEGPSYWDDMDDDEARGVEWRDPGWEVTFLDLMR